jgi:hypothetical protein
VPRTVTRWPGRTIAFIDAPELTAIDLLATRRAGSSGDFFLLSPAADWLFRARSYSAELRLLRDSVWPDLPTIDRAHKENDERD